MKAELVSHLDFTFSVLNLEDRLRVIVIVWKIPLPEGEKYPQGLKFSLIAFLISNPEDSILVDCHPPKGPHFHMNGLETNIEWVGFDETEKLFWQLVGSKFGIIQDGGI